MIGRTPPPYWFCRGSLTPITGLEARCSPVASAIPAANPAFAAITSCQAPVLSLFDPDCRKMVGDSNRPDEPLETSSHRRAESDLSTTPHPYRLDFSLLGIPVVPGDSKVSAARKNTLLYLRQKAIAEGKLLLPKPSSRYRAVFDGLLDAIGAIGLDRKRMELYVMDDDQPNASCIQGTRTVCVTTGLLKKPGLTGGELARVLGHEIGHSLLDIPDRDVPARFKNPLFRQLVLETRAARRQSEEYGADELGLLIADAAGHSVDEGLEMDRWLAAVGGEKGRHEGSGAKVLRPSESHPHGASRVSATIRILQDPRYVWRNRGVPAVALPFEPKELTKPRQKVEDFDSGLDPLDPKTVIAIARNPRQHKLILDEENMVGLLFDSLRDATMSPKTRVRKAILRLRRDAERGDVISRGYLQALLSKQYFDAAEQGTEEARSRVAWLERDCGISVDDVILGLTSCLESLEMVTKGLKSVWMTEKDKEAIEDPPSAKMELTAFISAFPHSESRDRLIASLLRFSGHIQDRNRLVESASKVSLPFSHRHLSTEGFLEFLQLLHGVSVVDFKNLIDEFDNWQFENPISEGGPIFDRFASNPYGPGGDAPIDYSLEGSLSPFINYAIGTAGPYDRGLLEAALDEGISGMDLVGINLDNRSIIQNVRNAYGIIEKGAHGFSDSFLRERVLGLGRIVASRILAALPVEDWTPDTVQWVERLPPSTERNSLLILLDRAGKRRVEKGELVFRDIPSPDEPGAFGGNLTLLNSFGFVDQGAAEGIYPTGQRALDRFMTDGFPKAGALDLDEILQGIPRPSPIRDELLNRCEADDARGARPLLDAYWSPTAAYAKAFDISSRWLKAPSFPGLRDVLEITDEFPSLRRRMVTEWVDRFGIGKEDYQTMLQATRDVDAMDLYRGGAVEHSRQASRRQKASVCLASFASALSRNGHSLLSLQDLEAKRVGRAVQLQLNEKVEPEGGEEAKRRKSAIQQDLLFKQYHPVLPENAASLARLLERGGYYELHRIPFVDGRPLPNRRFQREGLVQEGLAELNRWEGKQAFSDFMQAMGWQEAATFYEELLLGSEGVMHDSDLFKRMEGIFLEGIGLLLEEKGVPLSRVQQVMDGLKGLLARQPFEVRGQIWARILAGIAQQQTLGEIVREASRPLGAAAGGKLMQAIHSLTVGVDATLEEATRLALDQTANFTLFDALRFLGARGVDPFARHDFYRLLGQGSVRAAIAGTGGETEESAYLLVHARPSDPRVIRGITQFIGDVTRQGHYFPLTGSQFRGLVEQTEAERTAGFENHQSFGELHDWRLGGVRGGLKIPRVLETGIHSDWARLELAPGAPYTALDPEERRAVAPRVVLAALAQLWKATDAGEFLINPETHGGNILYDASESQAWLVDCGLLGAATMGDLQSLIQVQAGFARHGLAGAAAALLLRNGVGTLGELPDDRRSELLSGLEVFDRQLRAGTAPELLLPGLTDRVARSAGRTVAPGLDMLFRGLQHLAPYLRETGSVPFVSGASEEGLEVLVAEINNADPQREAGLRAQTAARSLPPGVAVGRLLANGSIATMGILKAELDPENVETSGAGQGMLICVLQDGRQFVRPPNLRVQVVEENGRTRWVTLDEYRDIQSARNLCG